MSIPHINAFFSCSYKEQDAEVNRFFSSICEALNINCKNVSDASIDLPPEKARTLIEDSKFLLAVATKRDQNGEKWNMPTAVFNEISMAFALKKPILLFVEQDVIIDGFGSSYCTFAHFDRENLLTPDFIKKAVLSIHETRVSVLTNNSLVPEQDAAGYYADSIQMLIELTGNIDDWSWKYYTSRNLIFTSDFSGEIKNSAWIDHIPTDTTDLIEHHLNYITSDNNTQVTQTITKNTPKQIEISLSFDKKPKKNDSISIDFTYSSKHFNPIRKYDIQPENQIIVNSQQFDCIDGIIPIQATKCLEIQFRFPSWYPIDIDSIQTIVASYSGGIDYTVDSEINRCAHIIKKFGSIYQIDIKVESPLLRHVYGIVWNLRK